MKSFISAACIAVLAAGPALAAESGVEKKAETCTNAACHGPAGNGGSNPEIPRLAGQYYDYLVRAISEYKAGTRKNAIMMPMVEKLTRRDVEELATYFSSQKGLVTK